MFLENVAFTLLGLNFIHGDLIHGYQIKEITYLSVACSITSLTYVNKYIFFNST